MEKQVKPGLKITFLVHFIAALLFGLVHLLIPDVWGNLVGWPALDPVINRILGAALLGYGVSSFLAYRETAWEKVIIVVRSEIAWTTLGSLVMLYALLFAGAPAIGWLNAVLLAGFAVAFSLFYSPAWMAPNTQTRLALDLRARLCVAQGMVNSLAS